MNSGFLLIVILFGVSTTSVLRIYLSRFKSTGWAFLPCFIYNSIFGVTYMGVLKGESLFGWKFSEEGYDYVCYGLTLAAMLFHVWAFVSVRYRDASNGFSKH